MPHSDAIPTPQPLHDQHAPIRAAFVAHLKPGAHLLNGQCGTGEDLRWLRAEGYVVTACEAVLADAKVASQQSGQAVRVGPLARMHSVLPYDGIWLSRPLDSDAVTLAPPVATAGGPAQSGCPALFPPAANRRNDPRPADAVSTAASHHIRDSAATGADGGRISQHVTILKSKCQPVRHVAAWRSSGPLTG